jgi:uncharacterized protein (DUF433 family)
MNATEYAHLAVDSRGRAVVAGTRARVSQIAADHVAHGMEAPEIHRGYPHLSLSVIHSALAYFYDHRDEIERQWADELAYIDAFFAAHPPQITRAVLEERMRAKRDVPA